MYIFSSSVSSIAVAYLLFGETTRACTKVSHNVTHNITSSSELNSAFLSACRRRRLRRRAGKDWSYSASLSFYHWRSRVQFVLLCAFVAMLGRGWSKRLTPGCANSHPWPEAGSRNPGRALLVISDCVSLFNNSRSRSLTKVINAQVVLVVECWWTGWSVSQSVSHRMTDVTSACFCHVSWHG